MSRPVNLEENDVDVVTLSLEKDKIINIYHISDIHIHIKKRHDEYWEVIQQSCDIIKKDNKRKIIVITGDVIDSKSPGEPDYNVLISDMFKAYSAISDVIVIAGNHDVMLKNIDKIDVLTSILEKIGNFPNVHYLKKSGFYVYNNLIFAVNSLLDNKFVPYDLIPDKYKKYTSISLYHGAVCGSVTDVAYKFKNGLTVDDFDGYSMTMLGDIHKYQTLNEDKTIAYAGSLIQQNYGEHLDGHGMIRWTTTDNSHKFIKIKNNYGFVKLNIVDGKYECGNWPNKIRLFLTIENTSKIQLEDIKKELYKKYDIEELTEKQEIPEITNNAFNIDNDDDNVIDRSQQIKIIKKYLKMQKCDNDIINNIIDLHKEISKNIDAEYKYDIVRQLNILVLKFDNFVSYGKNNIINFNNFEKNKIIGIDAPNRYGKSCIIDVILYCLFDKCSRGEHKDLINDYADDMKCSMVFTVNEKKYKIKRTATRCKTDAKVKSDVTFTLLIGNNKGKKKKILNGDKKTATNKIITDVVGDYDDYIYTSLILQKSGKYPNVMELTDAGKIAYLKDILRLGVFGKYNEYANTKKKDYCVQIKILEEEIKHFPCEDLKEKSIEVKNEIENIKKTLDNLNEIKFFETEEIDDSKYSILKKYGKTPQKITDVINSQIIQYKNNIDIDAIKQLDEYRNEISLQAELNIDSIQNDIDNLKKQLLPVTNDADDIEQLKQEIADLHHQRKKLEYDDDNVDIDTINDEINKLTKQVQKLQMSLSRENIDVNKNTLLEYFVAEEEYIKAITKCPTKIESHVDIRMEERANFANYLNVNINGELTEEWFYNYADWLEGIKHYKNIAAIEKKYNDLFDNLKMHILNDAIIFNNYIKKHKINSLNNKIKSLTEQQINIMKNVNIKKEIHKIDEWISKLEIRIKNVKETINNKKHNENILIQIKDLDDVIIGHNNIITNTNEKICALEKKIKKNKVNENKYDELQSHLILVKEYELIYSSIFCSVHVKKIENENKLEINNLKMKLQMELAMKQKELPTIKKNLEKYLDLREKYDTINSKMAILNIYIQMTNNTGIPYVMLKTYIPLIETDANNILKSMVDYKINMEFIKKQRASDKLSITCVNEKGKTRNVDMTSGFEAFTISLAIRIALSRFMTKTKPNFLIIDEGWSCIDKENQNKLGPIMEYLRCQYDYVILISHIDHIKMYYDRTITIKKKDDVSRIIIR
jgi:DNA repair exonuclease SbcCD ATPase subunit